MQIGCDDRPRYIAQVMSHLQTDQGSYISVHAFAMDILSPAADGAYIYEETLSAAILEAPLSWVSLTDVHKKFSI